MIFIFLLLPRNDIENLNVREIKTKEGNTFAKNKDDWLPLFENKTT